jgi:hypothetical protein
VRRDAEPGDDAKYSPNARAAFALLNDAICHHPGNGIAFH